MSNTEPQPIIMTLTYQEVMDRYDLKSNNETLSEMYPDIEVLCLIQRATNFIPEAIKTLNSIK